MLLIFATNDWLNDKEIWYDENDICRIQSTTQQHWCLYFCWLYAPRWLLGSGEEFNNYSRIWLCIKRTCHWWTTWVCKIVSWWNDANVDRCGRFLLGIRKKRRLWFLKTAARVSRVSAQNQPAQLRFFSFPIRRGRFKRIWKADNSSHVSLRVIGSASMRLAL